MFELQYHTPESFSVKNSLQHKLYEQLRVIEDKKSEEFIRLNKEIAGLSKQLDIPDDIKEIGSYGV